MVVDGERAHITVCIYGISEWRSRQASLQLWGEVHDRDTNLVVVSTQMVVKTWGLDESISEWAEKSANRPEFWGIQLPDLCSRSRGQLRRLRKSRCCNFKKAPNIKSFKREDTAEWMLLCWGRWCKGRTSLARAVSGV